jgi:hypothetical protein
MIFLISASQVARITGVNQQYPACHGHFQQMILNITRKALEKFEILFSRSFKTLKTYQNWQFFFLIRIVQVV